MDGDAAPAGGGDVQGRPPAAPVGLKCALHPADDASCVCSECARPLCPGCVMMSGGGHAFCRSCVEATAPVAAPAEGQGAGSPGRVSAGGDGRVVLAAGLTVLGLLVAALLIAAVWLLVRL